jgi:hypothetical protein
MQRTWLAAIVSATLLLTSACSSGGSDDESGDADALGASASVSTDADATGEREESDGTAPSTGNPCSVLPIDAARELTGATLREGNVDEVNCVYSGDNGQEVVIQLTTDGGADELASLVEASNKEVELSGIGADQAYRNQASMLWILQGDVLYQVDVLVGGVTDAQMEAVAAAVAANTAA